MFSSFCIVDGSNLRVINHIASESTQLDERIVIFDGGKLLVEMKFFEGTLAPLEVQMLRRIGGVREIKVSRWVWTLTGKMHQSPPTTEADDYTR